MFNNTKHRLAGVACVLGLAVAASPLAAAPQGLTDFKTIYGPSGVISSVTGVSGANGAADSIVVSFRSKMHPGNFGMGVNFAKAWTKTWNADSNQLTIGGDIDFADAADPTLIVYLMQKDADRKDIAEPNIFKFQDINLKGVNTGNGQANVDFDILAADGKGYSVYVAKSQPTRFKVYNNVNFNSKGVHIKGLENGQTYWVYVQYQGPGQVATRTAPVAITLP
jgi:hypothetical protein